MDQTILEIMKAAFCFGLGVFVKMFADINRLKSSVRAAHKKIRKFEKGKK